MPNSSTGGALLPAQTPAPLDGKDLLVFLNNFYVGITGMQGLYVRAAYQSEPPDLPDAGTAFMAFFIKDRKADKFPFVAWYPQASEYVLWRHELLSILCSFYDLGITGQAYALAELLRDGLAIPQNLETLFLNNMGLISVEDVLSVPVLLKQRWVNRVDLQMTISRQIIRTYPVLSVQSFNGILVQDNGLPNRALSAHQ
jgi:hypothetical protein